MNISFIDEILARRSSREFLDAPLEQREIDTLLNAAMSANDHGHLQPWEFRLYCGQGREQLAKAFIKHAEANGADMAQLEKARKAPFLSPAIICVSTLKRESRIPLRDQIFSAVSCCQLITLTAHLIGRAAIWKTGDWATSDIVRDTLGIAPDDEIVGFIYLGSPVRMHSMARKNIPENQIFRYT